MSHSVKKALSHFKKADPILFAASKGLEIPELQKSDDYFSSLCREIIGQQLSGKVVRVIFERFLQLFPEQKISKEHIILLKPEDLRGVGMSWGKVSFIRDLAEKVILGEVELDKFDTMSDQEVLSELIRVKGIGPWTAEMFLMFAIARPDVFSYGDLGLRNAIKNIYKFEKHPTSQEALDLSNKWSPYRTYASRILWMSLEKRE